jgi:uncharacterized protein YqcC (DUF446 family)
MVTLGHAAAEPSLQRAVNAFLGDQVSGEEWLQWGFSPRWRPWPYGTSTAGSR